MSTLGRIGLLGWLLAVACLLGTPPQTAAAAPRPNIVFILADDKYQWNAD